MQRGGPKHKTKANCMNEISNTWTLLHMKMTGWAQKTVTIYRVSSSKCFFFLFQIKSCLVANYFWIDSFSKFSHFFGKFTSGSLREDVSLAKGIFKRFPFRREISSWSPLRTRLLDQVWLKEEWSQLTLPTHLQANPQRQKNFQKSL